MTTGTERLITCIDPGNCTGVANGFDRQLVSCYAATPNSDLWVPTGFLRRIDEYGYLCVLELPRFYHPKKYKSEHKAMAIGNALIRESVTLGRWKERATRLGARCIEVFPSEWKGQVKKAAMVDRILSRLTPAERRLFDALELPESKAHNVADAIGMFLKMVGRLERSFGERPAALVSVVRPGRVRRVTRKAT